MAGGVGVWPLLVTGGGLLPLYATGFDEQSATELGLPANGHRIFPCVYARAVRAHTSDDQLHHFLQAGGDVHRRSAGRIQCGLPAHRAGSLFLLQANATARAGVDRGFGRDLFLPEHIPVDFAEPCGRPAKSRSEQAILYRVARFDFDWDWIWADSDWFAAGDRLCPVASMGPLRRHCRRGGGSLRRRGCDCFDAQSDRAQYRLFRFGARRGVYRAHGSRTREALIRRAARHFCADADLLNHVSLGRQRAARALFRILVWA